MVASLNIVKLIKQIYIYIYKEEKITELQFHKILYFLYALFYKEYKQELWNANFQAWQYGPVEINYRKLSKTFSDNQKFLSHFNVNFLLSSEQKKFLHNTITSLIKISVWDLVDYSHSTLAYQNGLTKIDNSIDNIDIQKSSINFKKIRNDKYDIRNILGYQKSNNEFFTPKEPVINLINKLNIPKSKIIWCPFDLDTSEFVIEFKKHGYKVINSHIHNKQDFFTYEPNEHFDVIISNPPFTQKRLLIERCQKFKKDFCLLYGTTIFSQSMGNTLNDCKFWFIQRNITFSTNTEKTKSFQCCWVMNKNFKYLKD